MLNTAVLFLIFNRPDTTARVFEKIREAKPAKLYLAADGPRIEKEGEEELCRQARSKVLENIDWNCEVQTLLRENNKGCKEAVSEGITWFFSHEEAGIILEDDTLPDSSFFRFCTELLEYYKDDTEVWSISGSNLLGTWDNSYSYLWGHGGIWGWATWRRAWEKYDKNMKAWPERATKRKIEKSIGSRKWFLFYSSMFDECYRGSFNTWDVQWFYTILLNNGYAINSTQNLVRNIGFGDNSTHTGGNNNISNLDSYEITFPLKHNKIKRIDIQYLDIMFSKINSTKHGVGFRIKLLICRFLESILKSK